MLLIWLKTIGQQIESSPVLEIAVKKLLAEGLDKKAAFFFLANKCIACRKYD
jgi:hypothetical protein